MNGLSCGNFCFLFCCPPCPSRIAAKLAFLPPEPSYSIIENSAEDGTKKSTLVLNVARYSSDIIPLFTMDKIEVFVARTRRGNSVACVYMRTNPLTKLTFLLSHGNAVDLGLMLNFMHDLGSKLEVNVMSYDYSGYGVSTGRPLEKNLYTDAECAIEQLKTRFSVNPENIVLYGQSIGTVPTVHLATRQRVGVVVLHSPLMSGLRVAFPRIKRTYCFDVFSNITKVGSILSPTLIIHGTSDEVIDFRHGEQLYDALPHALALEPLFLDGAGHNDCELYPEYLERLFRLIHSDLRPKQQAPNGDDSPRSNSDQDKGDTTALASASTQDA